MKKTLITLLALTGVAMGTTASFTIEKGDSATWGDMSTETPGIGITFVESDDILTLSYLYTTTNTTGDKDVDGWASPTNEAYTSTYSPSVQLQKNSNDSVTLTFSITNTGSETITLTGLTFDAYGINGNGSDKNAATVNLKGSLTGCEDVSFEAGAIGNTGTVTFTLSTPLEISGGVSTVLSLSLDNLQDGTDINTAWNTYVGITGGSVTYTVPEPATATLSLLALAGLAARRRRK